MPVWPHVTQNSPPTLLLVPRHPALPSPHTDLAVLLAVDWLLDRVRTTVRVPQRGSAGVLPRKPAAAAACLLPAWSRGPSAAAALSSLQ